MDFLNDSGKRGRYIDHFNGGDGPGQVYAILQNLRGGCVCLGSLWIDSLLGAIMVFGRSTVSNIAKKENVSDKN